jgi:tetratricopeptide (TPR) repeat protein
MASVTNEDLEAVVAANPEVVGMRSALAMRYFEERNLPKAIEHQTIVADIEPTADSLTVLGLFEFEGGAPADAATHLQAALELDPGYTPALWYLANVYLYGLDDGAAALPVLEELGAVEGLPDDIQHAVSEMIPIARGEEPAAP